MKTKYLTLKMVFISGVGRTGTGILRRALSRHNNILILKNNLRFFIDPDGIIPFCKILSSNWTPYQFDQSIKRLEKVLKGFSRKNKITETFIGPRYSLLDQIYAKDREIIIYTIN